MARPDDGPDDAFQASELPPIEGISFRHLRAPDDYAAMNTIANRVRVATGDPFATTDAAFAAFYDHLPDTDPATDVLVVTVDERIIGYARVTSGAELSADGAHLHDCICFLDPDWLRRGIGTAMQASLEARAREMAAGAPGVPHHLQAEARESAIGQAALLVCCRLRAGPLLLRHAPAEPR